VSRLQLALNVSDLDRAIDFYSKLFETAPAKVHPGYANFAIEDPPLKLVLLADPVSRGQGFERALNHLGIEVESADEVARTTTRLAVQGLDADVQHQTTCCYAVQDKAWVSDPDGAPWEVYTVLADAPAAPHACGDGNPCVPPSAARAAPVGGTVSSACC
jgi:catechol 2,3-dioxygenase-like lactoylglutathione lyase family enzyme